MSGNDSKIDVGSAAARVFEAAVPDFEILCFETAKMLAPLVESEIELMILTSFKVQTRLTALQIEIGDEFSGAADPHLLITPQFKWNGYRIDFCFRTKAHPEQLVFVECDGHEFHERTKEQAERDRSKDRAIQSAGIPILRFTGREIWRDTNRVTIEIINFLAKD